MSHYKAENIGVVVTDSHLTPLRRGVTGVAIAYSGFEGIQSEIGRPDLFGKPLEVTEKAVADDLASAAILEMGESGESTPFALIRGAPVIFTNREINPTEMFINPAGFGLGKSLCLVKGYPQWNRHPYPLKRPDGYTDAPGPAAALQ